jgi:CelD/BcsL family acetyltransferase involved in cellulose biosynthesis
MQVIENVSEEIWNQIAASCGHATFFHSPAWARIIHQTYPNYKSATLLFKFGADDLVLLPMMEIGREFRGLYRTLYSNVPWVYGGFISNRTLSNWKMRLVMNYLRGLRTSWIEITGNPFANLDAFFDGWDKKANYNHVLELESFDSEDELLKSYEHNVRQQVKKAIRENLSYAKAQDLGEIRDYYQIYLEAVRRWGKTEDQAYPFELFAHCFNSHHPGIAFWIVKKDHKVIGGNLNFYWNEHCVEWHCAYLQDYFKFGVRNFLVHRLVNDARQAGYKYYDFNPSGGNKGTERFKENFGAQKRPFHDYRLENDAVIYRALKIARTIVRR